MRIRSGRRRIQFAAVLAAIVAALAVSGTWAALGGGEPATHFVVELNGSDSVFAKAVVVDGAVAPGKKGTKEYAIRITLPLTDNAAPVQAFQSGTTYASLKIIYFNNAFEELKRYEFANATVVGYRQAAVASTNSADQDLILTSTSLTVP
jgi:hypothetical protein